MMVGVLSNVMVIGFNWVVICYPMHCDLLRSIVLFKMLIGKPSGKGPSGRPRCRWKHNIRMYLKNIGINTRNWVDTAQDRGY